MRVCNRVILLCAFLILLGEICGACGRSGRSGRSGRPKDTTPPTLSECPESRNYNTDAGKLYSTIVRWTEPTAWDNRDGNVGAKRIKGYGPGQIFYHGSHMIEYMAKDSSGNTATPCKFTISVTARVCQPLPILLHGWISCDQTRRMLVGTVCKFGCHPGYSLQGSDTAWCRAQDRWSISSQPVCKPRSCRQLALSNTNMVINCSDEYNFKSVCQYSCTNGFGILPGHTRVRTCDASGNWAGEEPICRDVTPPKYTSCPSLLVFYADRSKDVTAVSWQAPVHSDNAGLGDTIAVQIKGPTSGSVIPVGEYTVVYQAWDRGNNTATCEIQLTVKVITCHILYPRPYTQVTCPMGRRFGSTCSFKCQEGASLKGDKTVHCEEFNNNNVRYGQWTFGLLQPYCELKKKCIRPSPPEHGALSCDTWAFGSYCMLQCQQGYVVQDFDFDPLLTCSDSRGEFSGLKDDGTLPKCAEESEESFFDFKLLEYYYFVGDCIVAKEQIRQNFILALKASLGDVCSNVNCTTDLVEVNCFNEIDSGRKRRSMSGTLSISAVLTVSGKGQNKMSPSKAISMQEQIHQARAENNVSLDFGQEMALQLTSIQVSNPEVTCTSGSYMNKFTLSCVQCSRGTYHAVDADQCRPCPRGRYQPLSGQTTCMKCPDRTSTPFVASVDISQCVEACVPGYFSATGTAPCSPCNVGTFSSAYGQTQCMNCPGSKTTQENKAAKSIEECYDFDVEFSSDTYSCGNASVLFTPTSNCTSLYLTLWMKCSKCDRIFQITDHHKQHVLDIEFRVGYVDIKVLGRCVKSIPVHDLLDSPRWHHMSVYITAGDVIVSVDGTELSVAHECAYETLLGLSEYSLLIGGEQYIGKLTSLNLWANGFNIGSAPRCVDDRIGNLVAWRQFQDVDGFFLRKATQCDDVDNCVSSPCANGGTCTDGPNTLTCTCINGFTGDRCEVNINDCVGNSCQNGGTCIDEDDAYTCQCFPEFIGTFCETLIVDGGWTSWGMWGPCSVTCDSGQQVRERECSNPEPENGGANCTGEETYVQPCTTPDTCVYECDVDPPDPLHGSMNCSWQEEGTRQCRPFCDEGYAFDSDLFLDNIVCGSDTGYEWNIRNDENPEVQIGACSEIKLAEGNTMMYSGEYEDLTPEILKRSHTDVPAVILSTVQAQVHGLQCVKEERCYVRSIEVTNTDVNDTDIRRERRGVRMVGFQVNITCTPIKDPRSCYDLLEEAYNSLEQLVNETRFSILVEQTWYDIGINGTSVDGQVACPPGTVSMDYFCVQCGPGSYPVDSYCERCPRGTYKEDITSPGCTPCPPDWTTDGLQSRHASMCNVPVKIYSEPLQAWIFAIIMPSVVVLIVFVATIFYCYLRSADGTQRRGIESEVDVDHVNNLPNRVDGVRKMKFNTMFLKDRSMVCPVRQEHIVVKDQHIPVAWPETVHPKDIDTATCHQR